jgi:hypothetical protein
VNYSSWAELLSWLALYNCRAARHDVAHTIEMRHCSITRTLHDRESHSTKGARTKVALTESVVGFECDLSAEIELCALRHHRSLFIFSRRALAGENHEQYGRRHHVDQKNRAE